MKYSRILFPLKNDSLLVNMLPAIEHSVKNIRKGKVPKTVLKIRMVVPLESFEHSKAIPVVY